MWSCELFLTCPHTAVRRGEETAGTNTNSSRSVTASPKNLRNNRKEEEIRTSLFGWLQPLMSAFQNGTPEKLCSRHGVRSRFKLAADLPFSGAGPVISPTAASISIPHSQNQHHGIFESLDGEEDVQPQVSSVFNDWVERWTTYLR
jgi:hypothetical protein